jgi:homopolymeric O-antigen transport system permease protein
MVRSRSLPQLSFGLGLARITAVLHVFVRDTAEVVSVAFQFAFWATPVLYVESILPPWLQRIEAWNPLAPISQTHHDLALTGTVPSTLRTAVLTVLTAITLATGPALYRHSRADILDEL